MKKSKYTDARISYALQQAETGTAVAEACRTMGFPEITFHPWRKKHSDGMKILEKEAQVSVLDKKALEITREDITEQDGVIVRIGTMDRNAILESKRLKVIGRPGVGFDNIDVQAATEAGVLVVVTPNANTLSVAEHTIALILTFAKDIHYCDRAIRQGRFEVRSRYRAFEIQGKKIGLMGFGHIGRETARLSKALGMDVQVYDPLVPTADIEAIGYGGCDSLSDLLETSDIVSLHIPLNNETRNLIGRGELGIMKKDSLLVNCARGGTVDEDALREALETHGIAGAALDVFAREPVAAS